MHHRPRRARACTARLPLFIAVLAVANSRAPDARAQTSPGDAATAQALFDEAKKLSDAGDYAAACPKLAESNRLDPGGGTMTALAVCHEHEGKTATAWAEFIQVAADARLAKRADREAFARQRVAALEPKLSRLAVTVDPAASSVPGLELRRDDVVMRKPTWGTAIPVDPGDHVIEARANGKKTWSAHVTLGADADSQTVTVPPLDDAAVAAESASTEHDHETSPAVATPPPAAPDGGHGARVAGVVVGSVGIALAAVGIGFGVSAMSSASSANQLCPGSTCSNPTGVNDESSAKSAALVSDLMFGGAVVAAAVGAIVYLTAPSAAPAPSSSASVSPIILRGGGGAGYTLRW